MKRIEMSVSPPPVSTGGSVQTETTATPAPVATDTRDRNVKCTLSVLGPSVATTGSVRYVTITIISLSSIKSCFSWIAANQLCVPVTTDTLDRNVKL